jgi:hypothetical protein
MISLSQDEAARRPLAIGDKPTCPTCHRPAFGSTWAIGQVQMVCKWKHCKGGRFRVLALPFGTQGRQLVTLFGPYAGIILVSRIAGYALSMNDARDFIISTSPHGAYFSMGMNALELSRWPQVAESLDVVHSTSVAGGQPPP